MKYVAAAAVALCCLGLAQAESARAPNPQQMEKQMRTARTIALASELELDATHATQLDAAMAEFDARKKALFEQLKSSHETLEKAGRGEAVTVAQVDQAVQQQFDLQTQLSQLDREMFSSVSKGMSAQQKARFEHFAHGFGPPMGMHPHDGHGHGPEGMGPPPEQQDR